MNDYIHHYLSIPEFPIYLILIFAVLLFVVLMIRKYANKRSADLKGFRRNLLAFSLEERFYEIIFSGTSILAFMTVYYLIDRFVQNGLRAYWDKYADFLLLLFLICACIFNNILDHLLVRLRHISEEEMAAGRLIGMLYMILIFAYIKIIYQDDNYDMFIAYFLTLMVGRFVYFDASFKGFLLSVREAFKNIWLMLIALGCCGLFCLYGFKTGYLLTYDNGVLTNVFITHLIMCVAVIIVSRLPFFRNNTETGNKTETNAKKENIRSEEPDETPVQDDDIEILVHHSERRRRKNL